MYPKYSVSSRHPTYASWYGMKDRCTNTNCERYQDYGGRGITVCPQWLDSFEQFVDDMGIKPEGLTLDRINNDGNYEHGNCRWADAITQANNKRPTKNSLKTHCPRNHVLAAGNLEPYALARGMRKCIECRRIRDRNRDRERKSTKAAQPERPTQIKQPKKEKVMDVQKLDQKLETLNRQAAVARCNAYQLRNSEARIAMQIDQGEVGSRNRVLAEQLKSAGVPVAVLSESETKQQYLAERPLYLVKKLLLPDFQGNIAVVDAEFAGEFELVAGQPCTLPAVVAVVERELHAQNVELRRLYAEKNKPETQTISTKVVVDVDSGAVLERESYQYAGPVAKCCGATSGQKTAAANELKVSNLLTTQFQKIFSDNSNILSTLTNALTPVVNKGPDQYGFDAAEDSALRTQATDTIAAGNRNATNALRSTLAAQGGGTGGMLPSGSAAALEGDLAEQEANKQSDAQLGITEKGYETGRQNFFTAEGELAGAPGALENPATAAGGAAEGAASGAMQGQTDIANANNAWMAPVGGMIGAIAGAAVPKIPGMGGKPGCWIAEAIYGVDDFRTHLVRAWLNTEFTKQRIGRIVMAFYLKFGQRIAKVVRKNRILKTMLQPLFDAALRRALKEKN